MSVKSFKDIDRKIPSTQSWKNSFNSDRSRKKSRPKSVTMATNTTRERWLTYRHSADCSESPLSMLFCGFKKSRKLGYKKRTKNKKLQKTDRVPTRPVTWGPNGSKFSEMVKVFMHTEHNAVDEMRDHVPVIKPLEILNDLTNNNIEKASTHDRLSAECLFSLESALPPQIAKQKETSKKSLRYKTIMKPEDKTISATTQITKHQRQNDYSQLSATEVLPINEEQNHIREHGTVELVLKELVIKTVNQITKEEVFHQPKNTFETDREEFYHDIDITTKISEGESQDFLCKSVSCVMDSTVSKTSITAKTQESVNFFLSEEESTKKVVVTLLEDIINIICTASVVTYSPSYRAVVEKFTLIDDVTAPNSANISDGISPVDRSSVSQKPVAHDSSLHSCHSSDCIVEFSAQYVSEDFDIFSESCEKQFSSNDSIKSDVVDSRNCSLDKTQQIEASSQTLFLNDGIAPENVGSNYETEKNVRIYSEGFNDIQSLQFLKNIQSRQQHENNTDISVDDSSSSNDIAIVTKRMAPKSCVFEKRNQSITGCISLSPRVEKDIAKPQYDDLEPLGSLNCCNLTAAPELRLQDGDNINNLYDKDSTHIVDSLTYEDSQENLAFERRYGKKLNTTAKALVAKRYSETASECTFTGLGLIPMTKRETLQTFMNDRCSCVTTKKSADNDLSDISVANSSNSLLDIPEVNLEQMENSNPFTQLHEETAIVNQNRVAIKNSRPKSVAACMLNHEVPKVNCNFDIETAALEPKSDDSNVVAKSSFLDSVTEPKLHDKGIWNNRSKECISHNKRPTSLFCTNWSGRFRNSKIFNFLKDLSPSNLTPTTEKRDVADVFSEATERVLEENKSLCRQETFKTCQPPVKYRHRKNLSDEVEISGFSDKDKETGNIKSQNSNNFHADLPPCTNKTDPNALMQSADRSKQSQAPNLFPTKSASLPMNLKAEYHQFKTFFPVEGAEEEFGVCTDQKDILSKNRRALKDWLPFEYQEAAQEDSDTSASSGTVVASDEEFSEVIENNTPTLLLSSPTKLSSSAEAVFYSSDKIDATSFRNTPHHLERSQSLDKQRYLDLSDKSAMLDGNAVSSTPPGPNPTWLPLTSSVLKQRMKSKHLQHRYSKYTERQATEALEWLKEAGFPQYAHLYEVGNFPVDISSVGNDHDFLGQEHIAALVRRLNVLNRCANLKLDRASTHDTDDDGDEYEQYALSEFWHFEEDGHRWSRMDSKASSIGSPSSRLPSSTGFKMDGIQEDSNADVFTKESCKDSLNKESPSSEEIFVPTVSLKPATAPEAKEDVKSQPNKVLKSKGSGFFKRVGDFKKLGSFRRKELHRTNTTKSDSGSERYASAKVRGDGRVKGWRKNRKVVIGEPVLQCSHERFDHMRCVPIDTSTSGLKQLQNQHLGRGSSENSLVSSSSSSGIVSTTSTPVSKAQTPSDDFFFAMGEISPGIHGRNRAVLEMNVNGGNVTLRNKEQHTDRANSFYLIPRTYKPGTFPSSLREQAEHDNSPAVFSYPSSSSSTRSNSDSNQSTLEKQKRPTSVYDNLSGSLLGQNISSQDVMHSGSPAGRVDSARACEETIESLDASLPLPDTAFWSVDDIVEHTQSLQQIVSAWEEDECGNDHVKSVESSDSNLPAIFNLPPCHSSETDGNEDDVEENSSLSEDQTQSPLRWETCSTESNRDLKACEECLQFHTLSVGQLMILRRLSMLKLTALMESYAFSNSKGTLNWSVPRFIRRMKVPDYKDKSVFGVPLLQNVQRFGQPLPFCIQHALAFLKRSALDHVGIFRKPGVRSRIQKLREKCESDPDFKNFDDCSAYDVADMVKQFFRELPDPLMTMKMSETFVGIFLYLPEELRLQTLQAATILLPDETRETLKTLLLFLADVVAKSDDNHMTATNLSTCLSPSLFYHQLSCPRLTTSNASTKIRKSQSGKMSGISLGKPEMKEMNENKAANQCLGFMIRHVDKLFKISEDAMTQCRMSVMQQTDDVLATEIGYNSDHHDDEDFYTDFHSYVDRVVAQTVREEQRITQNKGGWQNVPSLPGSDLMSKKINDGNPLRIWRSQVEVTGANANQILDRILNERHLWDENLLQSKILEQPDEKTQLYHTVQAEMKPHPNRDYCVLRSWRRDINSRGALAIVETSTGQQALQGDVRGVILTSRYVIEPTDVPNKCTLTHVCRVDTKGRNPEWYNKAYGHIVSQRLLKIKDSVLENPPKV